ncbi:MAG: DUF559 domain-containing protein [Bacteroidetes bacterium]|nr:DUF559 domain-containing protein [Bacteroidota bacterium]
MLRRFNNNPINKDRRRELRSNPTRAESELWHGLRNHRSGYKFRRQQGLGPFIVDFYCPAFHLAVEVDGATHDSLEQQEYDSRRSEYLRANGIDAIRFTDGEVLWSVDICVAKIAERIEEIKRGRGGTSESTTPTPP